jgi:integrase
MMKNMKKGKSPLMPAYHFCARPVEVAHGHPYLVFNCQDELHLPLTVFAKQALGRLAPSSLKKYLTGILPWFTWLDTDTWQTKANRRWTDPPEVLRDVLREYLVSKLHCRVRSHPQGGEWLETSEDMLNAVRVLLAGLKLFYRIAKAHGYYLHENPLRDSFAETVEAAREQLVQDGNAPPRPKMPDSSGVDEPRRTGRLTDSYFLLKDTWIPQVVIDVEFPQKILDGGRALKSQGKSWGLREECVICLLFETGARVSEIMALTLGDWNQRGLKDTAWARNKGSRKRRAKYVRFSEQTVKLLKKYFDTERKEVDAHHYTLDTYLHLAKQGAIDLDALPLFLSQRGTPWTVESFRAHYWKKACAKAGIDADPHQARHWYVTQALIEIHERARKGTITVERGKEELIAYMHWRAGEKVLKAYNHFYQPANHAEVQNTIFKKLQDRSTKPSQTVQPPHEKLEGLPLPLQHTPAQTQQQSSTGEALYAFLIGTGGYVDELITDLITTD